MAEQPALGFAGLLRQLRAEALYVPRIPSMALTSRVAVPVV